MEQEVIDAWSDKGMLLPDDVSLEVRTPQLSVEESGEPILVRPELIYEGYWESISIQRGDWHLNMRLSHLTDGLTPIDLALIRKVYFPDGRGSGIRESSAHEGIEVIHADSSNEHWYTLPIDERPLRLTTDTDDLFVTFGGLRVTEGVWEFVGRLDNDPEQSWTTALADIRRIEFE